MQITIRNTNKRVTFNGLPATVWVGHDETLAEVIALVPPKDYQGDIFIGNPTCYFGSDSARVWESVIASDCDMLIYAVSVHEPIRVQQYRILLKKIETPVIEVLE